MSIEATILGYAYVLPEPTGEAALDAYGLAMEAVDERNAAKHIDEMFTAARRAAIAEAKANELEAVGEDASEHHRAITVANAERDLSAMEAARVLSMGPRARQIVRELLIGGSVDGTPITRESYATLYTTRGRHREPYMAALILWSRLGFFSVVAGSKSAAAPDEESNPSGAA